MVSKQKKTKKDMENEWGYKKSEGFNVYRIYL